MFGVMSCVGRAGDQCIYVCNAPPSTTYLAFAECIFLQGPAAGDVAIRL